MGRTVEDACPYKSKGFADEILLTLVGEAFGLPQKPPLTEPIPSVDAKQFS